MFNMPCFETLASSMGIASTARSRLRCCINDFLDGRPDLASGFAMSLDIQGSNAVTRSTPRGMLLIEYYEVDIASTLLLRNWHAWHFTSPIFETMLLCEPVVLLLPDKLL